MNTKNLVLAVTEMIIKVVITAVVIMVFYTGALKAYDYGYRIFEEAPMSTGEGRAVTVTIPEGMSSEEMGELFLSKGLIRDAKLFVFQYMFSEFKSDLKAGTFELSTSMTVEEMLKAMTTG